jgi:hypothetical protein
MKKQVNSKQMIDRYLCDVEKILPRRQKDAMIKDLKGFIIEQVAENEEDIYKVLEGLGSAKRIEENYEIVWKANKIK